MFDNIRLGLTHILIITCLDLLTLLALVKSNSSLFAGNDIVYQKTIRFKPWLYQGEYKVNQIIFDNETD